MAYWEDESFYQEDDYSEFFNLYPQDGTFQFAQTLPSMASFGHENSIYTLFQNNPPRDYGDYDSAITFSAAHCSASSFSQPLLIQYDPSLYDGEFNPNSTKFVVSYSVSEFGEPEFEEFNPTPYAGGYDPAQTYGKPLPATDEICHPKSQAGPVSGQGSNGSAALSKEKEESFEKEVKPPFEKEKESRKTNDGGENGGKKEAVNQDGSVKVPQISQIPTGNRLEAIDEEEEEEEESEEETNDGGENGGNREAVNENAIVPQISKIPTEYKPEAIDEDEEGEETSDGGENGEAVQISQIPSGYGLEAMDLCESLFGYWPCLSKMNKERDERENGCREIHENQWSTAADYLFGSSDPYAAMADEGRSSANPIRCHYRHHQLQSYHGYAENC